MSRPMQFKLEPHVDPPATKNGFIHDMSTYRQHRRHTDVPRQKRLTPAECAAEYWATKYATEVNMKHKKALPDLVAQQVHEEHTWHRFATTPHAFSGASR